MVTLLCIGPARTDRNRCLNSATNGSHVNQICKTTGDSALTFATENRASIKLIEELLKCGASVNHSNADGNTALKNVCQNSQDDIAKLLLEHGATADFVCKPTGQTALTQAVVNKFPVELIAELLKQEPMSIMWTNMA